eukprot:gene17070-biopygen4854
MNSCHEEGVRDQNRAGIKAPIAFAGSPFRIDRRAVWPFRFPKSSGLLPASRISVARIDRMTKFLVLSLLGAGAGFLIPIHQPPRATPTPGDAARYQSG